MKLSPALAVFVYGACIALGFAAILLHVSPTVPTAVVCAIPLVCTACYWCSKKGKNPIGEETPLASSLSDSVEALGNYSKQILATEPAVKVREDYFDNLKVFLTVVVVMHHTVCAFVGTSWFYAIGQFDGNSFKSFGFATLLLNQSYFMSLFFLISGYFIPPSYDKKGSCEFMVNKLKRLGVPFYLFSCLINPLLIVAITYLYNNGEYMGELSYQYYFLPGVAWYIAWLLLFSTVYTTIKGNTSSMFKTKPTLAKCLIFGFFTGIIQLLILVFLPNIRAFAMMPITFGSLPMDILFFIVGVCARRGKWLRTNAVSRTTFVTPGERRFVTIFTALCIVTCYAVWYLMADAKVIGMNVGYGIWSLLSGPYAVSMSIFLIDTFQRKFNYRTSRTRFFSKSAYMVYLFHPWVLVSLTFAYNYFLKHGCGIIVEFENHSFSSTTKIPSKYIWIGFVTVGLTTQLVVWPLSFYLRKLPGLRQVM